MRGWLAVGAIIGAAFVSSAGSAAARTTTVTDRSVVIEGNLSYVWHGDPARGCAAAHVCGDSGAIIATPEPSSDLLLDRGRPSELDFGGGAANVRVERVGADGSVADCTETLDQSDVAVEFVHQRAAVARAYIMPLQMSRCETPLIDDLARLHLTAGYPASRPTHIDLRGRIPFVSGPYSGMLISTLRVQPDSSMFDSGGSSSSEGGAGPPPQSHRRRFEYVSMRYRATFAGARPTATFAANADGVCAVFDSCGVTGSTTVAIPPASFTFRVIASRPVRRPVGRARVLADLAAGRLTMEQPTYTSRELRGTVTAQVTRNGTTQCQTMRAAIPLRLGVDGFQGAGDTLTFSAADASDTGVALRAYCAGPTTTDVLGYREASELLSGTLRLKDLGPPQSAVDLARLTHFHSTPYSGTWQGVGFVILRRLALTAGTRWEHLG